ncbi:MAG TPA: type II toxin-antitoxin system PemK/MazF family toxin [Chloroflexota bacterium]|nr:type II toxin-antitoxin system PemK/MazF family toxin [Chloroflexota bacterium]
MIHTPHRRGEIWLADLSPTKGHEQSGRRPVLIVSDDVYNASRAGLVAILPLATKNRGIRLHIAIHPPEGGTSQPSFIMCDQIRVVAAVAPDNRLITFLGKVGASTMEEVDFGLRLFLNV